jgi:cardiolipin synthase
LTDYLDGYVARAYNQVSSLGRFLDPLADKLLVVLTLVMLVGSQTIKGSLILPVLLMIAREIAIPSLRDLVQEHATLLKVSLLAKWKTALQMGVITFFLLDDQSPAMEPFRLYGALGLWAAAWLTVWSGYLYGRQVVWGKSPPDEETPSPSSQDPLS